MRKPLKTKIMLPKAATDLLNFYRKIMTDFAIINY